MGGVGKIEPEEPGFKRCLFLPTATYTCLKGLGHAVLGNFVLFC